MSPTASPSVKNPSAACPFCHGLTVAEAYKEGQAACSRCDVLLEFGLLPNQARARLAQRLDKNPTAIAIGVALLPDDTLCVAGWYPRDFLTATQAAEAAGLDRYDLLRRLKMGLFPGAEKVEEGGFVGAQAPWRIPRSAITAWQQAPRKPRGGGSEAAQVTSATDGRLKDNRDKPKPRQKKRAVSK